MAKAPHVDRGDSAPEPTCTPEERDLLSRLGGADGVRRRLWSAALVDDAFKGPAHTAARALKRRDEAARAYEAAWDALLEVCDGFPGGFVFDRLREMAEELPEAPRPAWEDSAPEHDPPAAYDRAPDAPKSYSSAADGFDLSAVMVPHNDPFTRGNKPGPGAGPVLDGAAPAPAAVDPADAEKRRRMGLG